MQTPASLAYWRRLSERYTRAVMGSLCGEYTAHVADHCRAKHQAIEARTERAQHINLDGHVVGPIGRLP